MKVFEFQFNPQEQKDRLFKAFSSESLFFVGELANALPQNAQFLSSLANTAKSEYYASNHNLKKTLQKINWELQGQVKNGNVDWMGNLHAALLAFSRKGSSQIFSFAKSGTIKVLMARRGSFVDLGKTVENFKNFVSGEVLPEDKIIVCTKELFDVLSRQNLLGDLAFFHEEKQFQELFKPKEKELKKISGVLLSFVIEHVAETHKKRNPAFSIPKLKIRIPNLTIPSPQFLKINVKIPVISSPEKRKIMILSLFGAILLMGFGVFGAREDGATAATIQKVKSLESNKKFLEAWETLSSLANSKKTLPKEVFSLKQELEIKLLPLYFVEDIKKPELFYQVKKEETNLIPHDMTLSNSRLYLSNPFSPQIFEINIENKNGQLVSKPKNSKTADSSSSTGFSWVLLNGNEIQKYYKGSYQKSFKPNIFPPLSHGLRVKTSSQFKYLYVLDPSEKRIVIFTKSGELIKQYQSSAFDNLTDFAVSSNEKAMYLLNGSLIFRILL